MPIGVGTQENNVTVNEFREPGVMNQVTAGTVSADAQFVLATAVGILDERIPYTETLIWLSSSQGAVLEQAADGLRVASTALGAGLTGGGADVMTADITGLPATGGLQVTDEVMIWNGSQLQKTTVNDLTGIGAGTISDLASAPTATTVVITNTGGDDATIAAAVSGTTAGVITGADQAKLDGIAAGATVSDLAYTGAPTTGTVTNTGGDDVVLPAVVPSGNAGLMSGADKTILDNLVATGGTVSDLASVPVAGLVTITNTGGDDATILAATNSAAGVITASDRIKLDGIATGATVSDLGYTAAPTQGTVTNTGGVDATLPIADVTNAGLMSAADKATLDGFVVDDAMSDVSTNAVQNAVIKAYVDSGVGALGTIVRVDLATPAETSYAYTDLATALADLQDDELLILPPRIHKLAAEVLLTVNRVRINAPHGATIQRALGFENCDFLFRLNGDHCKVENITFDGLASGTNNLRGTPFIVNGNANEIYDCHFINAYSTDGTNAGNSNGCHVAGDSNLISRCVGKNCLKASFRFGGSWNRSLDCSSYDSNLSFNYNGNGEMLSIVNFYGTVNAPTPAHWGSGQIDPGSTARLDRCVLRNITLDLPIYQNLAGGGQPMKVEAVEHIEIDGLKIVHPVQNTTVPTMRFNTRTPRVSAKSIDTSGYVQISSYVDTPNPDSANNQFASDDHLFRDHDRVQITSTGAVPTGLNSSTWYYVKVIDADTYQLTTDRANAIVATFSDNGTATVSVRLATESVHLYGESHIQRIETINRALQANSAPFPDLKIRGWVFDNVATAGNCINVLDSPLNRLDVDDCIYINRNAGNIYQLQNVSDTRVLKWGANNIGISEGGGLILGSTPAERRNMFLSQDGQTFRATTGYPDPTDTTISWNVGDEWIDDSSAGDRWQVASVDVDGHNPVWVPYGRNSVRYAASVAALAGLDVEDNTMVILREYIEGTPGGGGILIYEAASTETVDNGLVFNGPSGTGRYLRQWDQNTVNVLWYGADATEATDATAAIQAAFDAAGTRVELPDGNYATDRLTLTKSKTIFGRGVLRLRQYPNTDSNGHLRISAADSKLQGIGLHGNSIAGHGISIAEGTTDVHIDGVTVQKYTAQAGETFSAYGIRIEPDCNRTKISHCHINGIDGVNTNDTARGVMVWSDSVAKQIADVQIANNSFDEITPTGDADGIVVQGFGEGADDTAVLCTISNNVFRRCAKRAVKLQNGGCTVVGNLVEPVYTDTFDGIAVQYGGRTTIVGNTFIGTATSAAYSCGTSNSAYSNVTIQGNTCRTPRGHANASFRCVNVQGTTADSVSVVGNTFHGQCQYFYRNDVTTCTNMVINGNTILGEQAGDIQSSAIIFTSSTAIDNVAIIGNVCKNKAQYFAHDNNQGIITNLRVDGNVAPDGWQEISNTMLTNPARGDGHSNIYIGSGTPEGVVAARVGSLYRDKDGGAGTVLYVKESGTSTTGWVAK